MERQLFDWLMKVVLEIGRTHAGSRKQFSDSVIVGVLLWAVIHDRPISWACREQNWPSDRRWLLLLPSPSTMSRRLKTYGVHLLLEQVAGCLREAFPQSLLKILDGKPLMVGPCSKDKDARRGYAACTMAKGYKICTLLDASGAVDAWRLEPMNGSESLAAQKLIALAPGAGYVVADRLYDTNALYEAAGRAGWQLIVRPIRAEVQKRYRLNRWRARGLELSFNALACCGQSTSFGQDLLVLRDTIDRRFGWWGNFGGGLAPLPNWVRRPHRVVVWVHAKLLIAAARALTQHNHLAA